MTDRETLELVAKGYNDLVAIQNQQKETMAKMLRACLHRLRSPNSKLRKEAMEGLEQLAMMLEKQNDR